MLPSIKLTLTAVLAGSTLTSAAPNWWPPHWPSSYPSSQPPSYGSTSTKPTIPGYGGSTTSSKCTTSYHLETITSSKPYTTFDVQTGSTNVYFTNVVPITQIVTVTYKTTLLSTIHTSKTKHVPYLTSVAKTQTSKDSYQCSKTTFAFTTSTSTEYVTKAHKASLTLTLTKESKSTSIETGVKTETTKSLIPTFKPSVSIVLSTYTSQKLVPSKYTTEVLKTKTHTSIWTEVETVPQVLKTTITQNIVGTSTKEITTSVPTTITTKITTTVPYTSTKVVIDTYTTTVYKPTKGFITLTHYATKTIKLPSIYFTTCVTDTTLVTYVPVTRKSLSISSYDLTKKISIDTSSTKQQISQSSSVGSSLSTFTKVATQTGFSSFLTTVTDSSLVCTSSPSPSHYGWN